MTELRYDTISFISDYGLSDEFAGVVKSVIRSIAPSVHILDITHGIRRHDIRAGGLALARASQYLVPGVVLAVVDPGVGTDRRAVAVEVGDGQSILIGPDNGVLAPAVAMVGGATRAFELDKKLYHLESPGSTFDGRDIFAPCAAHVCKGVELSDLGREISTSSLLPGVLPVGGREGDLVVGEVLWVDHFGNVQLNVDPADIEGLVNDGRALNLQYGETTRQVEWAGSFEEISPGAVGLLIDSCGLVMLAIARGSAAEELHIGEGAQIRLSVGTDVSAGVTTQVKLGQH